MLGEIRSFLKLGGIVSKQVEYWKEYEGEIIDIRSHSIERQDGVGSSFSQSTYIIRGEIKDVRSYPPGFLLRDVKEILHISDFEITYGADTPTSEDIWGVKQSGEELRTIDEKFVSFDEIQEIERIKDVESADEPYRDELPRLVYPN